jgi:hypothetical protein
MKVLLVAGAVYACSAVAVGLYVSLGCGAGPVEAAAAPVPSAGASGRLVVHEWGTFTSFSGSDGVPVGFRPDNSNLPGFVYYQDGDPGLKERRLSRDGTVSMETPVIYFYADRETKVSARVDFPRGWITEWYPYATSPPARNARNPRAEGQSIRWDVKLVVGEAVSLPREEKGNQYYQARATDAVPVQAEAVVPERERDPAVRGGSVVQREKFLFYRGVGTFPPPVSVRALGNGAVRVRNTGGGRVGGLVLVTVKGGKVGFTELGALDAGAETTIALPAGEARSADLADVLVKELTGAGLYEKEARAMVKTWEAAWFGEEGARLLYLVPRARTDELLPLTVEPKPTEVARVLVGRHDFLTPEQEAAFDRQAKRARGGQPPLDADQELLRIGRFAEQARRMAAKRLEEGTAPR